MTAAEEPGRFAFRAEGRDFTFTVELRLEASGDGTKVRQRTQVELGNFALKLMASKIRDELERKQQDDLARLKQLAEA